MFIEWKAGKRMKKNAAATVSGYGVKALKICCDIPELSGRRPRKQSQGVGTHARILIWNAV